MSAITFFIVIALAASSTQAFITHASRFGRSVLLHETTSGKVDSSEAIKAALEASQRYGPTSSEARVAWEAVEEINASDNSAAYTGGVTDAEYASKLDELAKLLSDQKDKLDAVRNLAFDIRSIKLSSPKVSAPSQDPVAMTKALQEAKAATEKYGISSKEAKLAWATVEEVASTDNSEAMKGSLDDECLIETIEACEALHELQRVVHLEKNKISGRYQG